MSNPQTPETTQHIEAIRKRVKAFEEDEVRGLSELVRHAYVDLKFMLEQLDQANKADRSVQAHLMNTFPEDFTDG